MGMLFYACDEDRDEGPVSHIDLSRSKWQVQGFVESHGSELLSSRSRYVLEFVNDSLFTINLDANRYFGMYESEENGYFKIRTLEKKEEICCDSQYANALLQKILEAGYHHYNGETLTLNGNGEIHLGRVTE
jgi:hypothetical protein